jgi:hypothetical protein
MLATRSRLAKVFRTWRQSLPPSPRCLAFTNDPGFNSLNRHAVGQVEAWLRAQPALFPPPDSLVNCEAMREIGPVVALYDRHWTKIKAR